MSNQKTHRFQRTPSEQTPANGFDRPSLRSVSAGSTDNAVGAGSAEELLRWRLSKRRARLAEVLRRRLLTDHSADLARDHRGFWMRRLLAFADVSAIAVAGVAMIALELVVSFSTAPRDPVVFLPLAVIVWLSLAGLTGMYHVDEKRLECSIADEIAGVVQIAAVWTWLLFLVETLATSEIVPVAPGVALWMSSIPLILLGRSVVRRLAQRRPWYRQSAFVVGRPEDAARVTRLLERHPEYGVDVVRELTLDPDDGVGRIEALIGMVEHSSVDRVIFAGSYEGLDERTGALRLLSDEGIKVDLVPGDSEVFRSDAELHFIEGLPLLTLPTTGRPRSVVVIKRAIDLVASALGLLVLSPAFAYIAIRIKLDSPGPVFFHQARVGEDGERFELTKFRTMTSDADARKHEVADLNVRTDGMFKIANDPRVTRFGAKLRRLSLDELPQLINVVRGEMSLVGPRPLIEVESNLVDEHYLARFDVRPGITGPWQVLGRSEIPFEEMLKLDYRYVTNWSIGDDVKLLVRTLSAMSHGRGAY